MIYENTIGYLELKRSVESVKENIKEAEISIQMNKLVLATFEKELSYHPEPVMPPLKKKK
jgi:hypothetical protein